MNIDDFRRLVRRDDYGAHIACFLFAAASVVIGSLLHWGWLAFGGMGTSLIASGFFAIRGGKSAVTSLHAPGVNLRFGTAELEQMSPAERGAHARLTGAFLITMGLLVLGVSGWHFIAASIEGARVQRSGEAYRDVTGGRGLAAGDGYIVWGLALGFSHASEFLDDPEWVLPRGFDEVLGVAADGKRLAVAAEFGIRTFELTATGAVERGDFAAEGVRAVALDAERVAWLDSAGVHVGHWGGGTGQPLDVALPTPEKPWVLALQGERVWYGPTEACGLAEVGTGSCVADDDDRPCGIARHGARLAFVTLAHDVFVAEPGGGDAPVWPAGEPLRARRVASGLQGCGVALDAQRVFVAGPLGAYRIDPLQGTVERIFAMPHAFPIIDAALGQGRFYFRGATRIHTVFADAPAQ